MTFYGVLIWNEHETWNLARDSRLITQRKGASQDVGT